MASGVADGVAGAGAELYEADESWAKTFPVDKAMAIAVANANPVFLTPVTFITSLAFSSIQHHNVALVAGRVKPKPIRYQRGLFPVLMNNGDDDEAGGNQPDDIDVRKCFCSNV